MHWLLFIHKILFSSTCFEPQVLIFKWIQLYTCNIWQCHSLWEFVVACRYTAWVRTQAVYRQANRNSRREWHCHMLHVYNCILLKMSTWGSKHVEENNILWINNNQCIKLVINIESIHDARSENHQVNCYDQTCLHAADFIRRGRKYVKLTPQCLQDLLFEVLTFPRTF